VLTQHLPEKIMRVKLTPGFIAKAPLPETGDRVIYWDSELRGFGLMVTKGDHRSFLVQYRAGRRSHRMHFKGGQSSLNVSDARREAKAILGAVAKGGDPLTERRKAERAGANTLYSISEEYLRQERTKLRSIEQRRAAIEGLIYPKLGKLPIDDIRRSDIVRLLDRIADERGAPMADHVLAIIRRIMSWHASRSDDFRSPIVRGMARTSPQERARDRTLNDDELRAIWKAADELRTPFAAMLKFILLTGTRRNEAAQMRRSEIDGDRWLIPAARYKTKKDLLVPLTPAALAVLAELPVINNPGGFVFTTGGDRPIAGFTRFKARFDQASGVTGWTIHDLRRTARTLMSRAGVDQDHAERALGHVIGGVRGVYDRHEFEAEKRRAFEALAALIERILTPQDNVVPLRGSGE
jgi:integrase